MLAKNCLVTLLRDRYCETSCRVLEVTSTRNLTRSDMRGLRAIAEAGEQPIAVEAAVVVTGS